MWRIAKMSFHARANTFITLSMSNVHGHSSRHFISWNLWAKLNYAYIRENSTCTIPKFQPFSFDVGPTHFHSNGFHVCTHLWMHRNLFSTLCQYRCCYCRLPRWTFFVFFFFLFYILRWNMRNQKYISSVIRQFCTLTYVICVRFRVGQCKTFWYIQQHIIRIKGAHINHFDNKIN